jgi:chromosome partitioning protein
MCLARHLAGLGKKVLLVDTDPQGTVLAALGLRPTYYLASFVSHGISFQECVVKARENIDVVCSNRETATSEASLTGNLGRELTFRVLFEPVQALYDAIVFDVAPSISLLQTCAMIYAQKVLIPLDMDPISYQGAVAAYETAFTCNKLFRDTEVRVVGILPTKFNKALQMTKVMEPSIRSFCDHTGILLLPPIRQDVTIAKAMKSKQFVEDFDPSCKAMEDYTEAFTVLLPALEETTISKLEGEAGATVTTQAAQV